MGPWRLRIVGAGNVAGEGAKMALLSLRERAAAQVLLEEVRHVELSDRADFNDRSPFPADPARARRKGTNHHG